MPMKKPPAEQTALSKDRPKLKVVKAPAKAAKGPIYQLKITLKEVKPPIWRRVQTKDCTLADLHEIIQVSMGWDGYHLHVIEIDDEQYGLPEQWEQGGGRSEPEVSNSRKLKLSQVVGQGVKKFKYLYDMGDGWEHAILIEKVVGPDAGVKYPRCIDGKRACPPEDCGGPWGYGDFLEAISNPKHPEHAEMVGWSGGEFDPERFDLDEANKALNGSR
jgi:hypothetical protein